MQHRNPYIFRTLLLLAICAQTVSAQNASGTLRGQVTDITGAVIPQATVTATSSSGKTATAVTDGQGIYEIKSLVPGRYTVTATAKGFSIAARQNVAVFAGKVEQFDIPLDIAVQKEEVEVQTQPETPMIEVAPESSTTGAIVLKGKDLEALSDDPDELQSELEALAGPAAGPNGGQIYIDGFTGGQLPPKSAIREIRINQNPFSAEYDKLGYGRIEIFTKPGTNQFHGQFFFNDNNSALNSKNPYIPAELQPDYQSEMFNGNISGPLNKHASFFFNAQRRNINDTSIVAATGVPPELGLAQLGVPSPKTRTNITPRLDYQLTPNNTLTVRYQYTLVDESNQDVGQLALASQGYNVSNTEHTLQISDTQVLSPKVINETRFQYMRERNTQIAQNVSPTVNVLGAFVGGGNSIGLVANNQDRFELQNYTSMSLDRHFIKFGGRLRAARIVNNATSGFNGAWTFPSLTDFNNGDPSQLSIVQGQPITKLTAFDVGLFAQDEWKIRPNMVLSYGLRFETQNQINDHADLAPRVSFAWGLGHSKTPKTVLRAGFGIFYDRFNDTLVLQAERLNGVNLQQFVVNPPPGCYPDISACLSSGSPVQPTVYQIDPRLHAPYVVQSAVAVERQVSKNATVSITYLNSRGFDQLLTRNINAPLPGTFNPSDPTSGIRPFGNIGNIYQYESEGIFKQNQLITNFRISAGPKLSLFGFYALSYANSDTGGANSFPSNQYNLLQDYGRAAFDVRHRLFLGGTIALPYAFRVSPFILATSGHPYNITLGHDMNGDSIFNDRPGFCEPASTDCMATALGNFDLSPGPNDPLIPVNYRTGPGQFTVNMRLAKTFGFGKRSQTGEAAGPNGPPHGGPHGHGGHGPGGGLGPGGLSGGGRPAIFGPPASEGRYSLTFSIFARNLLNRLNPAPPIGVLTSPLFGQSNALAGGPFGSNDASRRVDMQVIFSF